MQAATIEGWLDDLRSIHTYEAENEAKPPGIHADSNAIEFQPPPPPPSTNTTRKRGASLPPTPSVHTQPDIHPKRRKQTHELLEPKRGMDIEGGRAESSSCNQASKYIASLTSLTDATTLSQSSISGSRNTSRKRSRSPAKTVQDLRNATPPTVFLVMRHDGVELPATVKDLDRRVLQARKKGPLDGDIRSQVTPHLDDYDAQDDDLFNDNTDEESQNVLKTVLRIVRNTIRCVECDKSEASWGEEVVRPLLDLAMSRTDGRTVIENITSINIQPSTLVPNGPGVEALPFESKRVDYGLFLEPTTVEAKKITHLLGQFPDQDDQSINQARGYLQEKPLLLSIELKKTRSNYDPLLQLAIWNSALFSRLERLFELRQPGTKPGEMLPVPSIVIRGRTWELYYSYIAEDGSGRVLRGLVEMGNTNTVIGVYQVLAVLLVITRYGVDTYWPWLSRCLLE